jgi:hypothetical protein
MARVLECPVTPLPAARSGSDVPSAPASAGLFPLVHLPGAFGMFIAVGPTTDECMRLKKRFLDLRL